MRRVARVDQKVLVLAVCARPITHDASQKVRALRVYYLVCSSSSTSSKVTSSWRRWKRSCADNLRAIGTLFSLGLANTASRNESFFVSSVLGGRLPLLVVRLGRLC